MLDVAAGAIEIGVKELSVYAFSTENWRRSPGEVRFIMGFARKVLRVQRDVLNSWNVRLRWIGRTPRLWKSVLHELREAERVTAHNTGLDPQPVHQLRRAGRDRRRHPSHRRGRGRRPPQGLLRQREDHPALPLLTHHAGRGPVHPHRRRAAHLPTSSCGPLLTPSSTSHPWPGPTSTAPSCGRPARPTPDASAATAGAVDKVLHEEPTGAEDPEDDEADESPHHDGK